jgi:hypothetical protein
MPPSTMHTCSGTTDGVPCACLRFEPRPLQKADEPVTCLNCLHYDTCHPEAESTSTSSNDPRKSNIPTIVSNYSALLRSSKPKATIDDAREETNAGFLKTDGDDEDSWSYKPTSKNKGQFQVTCNFKMLLCCKLTPKLKERKVKDGEIDQVSSRISGFTSGWDKGKTTDLSCIYASH